MKNRVLVILVAAALLCMVPEQSAWAQRGARGRGGAGGFGGFGGAGFGGRGFAQRAGGLWSRDDVQAELKLSEEQKGKLADLNDRRRDSLRNFRDMSDEQRAAAQEEQRQQTQGELQKILTAPQLARLKQIELQQEGPAALARDEVSADLDVSEEQKGKIDEIVKQAEQEAGKLREEMQGAFRGGFGGGGFDRDQLQQRMQTMRERSEQINKQRDERLLGVLNEDQRDKWQTMLGAPFVLQDAGFGRGFGGVGREGRGRERARPAAEALPQAEIDTGTGEKLIRFNFQYHPWDEVLNWFADQAGLSLHADNKPTGTCNYTDPTAYKTADALDRLNELLITKNFILIQKDKTLFCWDLAQNPIPPSLVPEVPPQELDQYGENSMVTVKLFLERLLAGETAEQLQSLKGPFGTVTALPAVNLLVITDTAGNVRRIRDVLFGVDQSGGEGALRTFQLRHTQAKEVANQVRQLLGLPLEEEQDAASNSRFGGGRSRGGDWRQQFIAMQRQMQRGGSGAAPVEPQARVVADTRLNRVLVAAPPDDLARAARAIEELDQPLAFGDPTLAPQLDRYVVRRSDPDMVVSMLQQALGEGSTVRLTADRSTGSIWVFASMSQQEMIRNIINQMEGTQGGVFGGGGQRMFNVGTLDAEQLTEVLRALWQQSGGENQIILVPGAGQSATGRPAGSSRLFTPQSLRWERQQESRQAQFERRRRARDAEAARTPAAEGTTPTEVKPTSGSAPAPRIDPKPTIPSAVTQRGEKTASAGRGANLEVRYVSFVQESTEANAEQEAEPAQVPDTASPAQGTQQETPAKPPVIIRLENGVLTVQSEDKEALERIERLLSAIVPSGDIQAPFYVAPLHEAEVNGVAATIEQVLRGTVSSTFSGEIVTAGSPQIIADERTNSLLIVGASAAQRSTIDQLISVLDTADLPENALNRQPQLIPVENTSAAEVAAVLEDVFADFLQDDRGRNRGSDNNGQDARDFFARFQSRQGWNDRNRNRNNGRTQQTTQRSTAGRMTLGVDERTNTIVVSAPQALFEQVEDLVKQLDAAAQTSNRSIRLVPVQLSNVSAAQQTLSVLLGNGSGQSSRTGGRQATNRGPTGFQGFQGFQRPQRSQGNTSFGSRRNGSSRGFNGFTGNRGGETGGNFFRGRGGDNGGRGGDRGRRGGDRD